MAAVAADSDIHLLSGGAAQGLVGALASRFLAETGCTIAGTYSAVGAMRDKLVAGAPADLVILTTALVAELTRSDHVAAGSVVDIGIVRTGVAVRAGDPVPIIDDGAALGQALAAADAIYFPDPRHATAGIHFAKVLAALGIDPTFDARLRPFPNGATAMSELSASAARRPIGCTQVTEILATPGVLLVDALPREYELETVYTAGVVGRAARPQQARHLADLLAGGSAAPIRQRLGFEAVR